MPALASALGNSCGFKQVFGSILLVMELPNVSGSEVIGHHQVWLFYKVRKGIINRNVSNLESSYPALASLHTHARPSFQATERQSCYAFSLIASEPGPKLSLEVWILTYSYDWIITYWDTYKKWYLPHSLSCVQITVCREWSGRGNS